ncbi:hypothetical protein MMC17_010136 [Xylographa soralifera]|nr:hypothetical protein [Xylographa soralifera]
MPSVESVDEDYEPPGCSTSRASVQDSTTSSWDQATPAPALSVWSDIHEIVSPEPIRRPLADREDSLIPPSTISSLHNVTPRSTPTPVASSSQRPADNLESQLPRLDIKSPEPQVEKIDALQELTLGQLANFRLGSPETADFRPVSVRDEELPQRPYFDQSLQTAIKEAQNIIGNIADELAGSASAQNPESGLHALKEQALQSRYFEIDATSTIGIVGESAAGKTFSVLNINNIVLKEIGKSSLINSLLDLREVARTDDNGSAVTNYVTEYRYRKTHHKAAFTIEAEFLTSEEIDLELKELLHNYRQAFRDGINNDTAPAEYEEILRRSDVAIITLKSIFSAHHEISEEFLQDKSPNAFEHILHHLQSLASSLTWPEGAVDGRWTTTADNVENYRDEIESLNQEGLFPLIRIVRVYLNALILKSGVALADMPGLGDTNLARLQAAKRYLDRCDQVFIVNKINRAATSTNVKDAIKTQEAKGLIGRKRTLTVVCTGSEDIDTEKAERRNLTIPHLKAIKPDHIRKARDAIDRATALDSLKAREEAQIRYAILFITARNNSIKEDVIKSYSSLARQHELKVFCVSNRYYEGTNISSINARDIARSISGISELRQFCHTVVAEAQFHAAIHYLDVKCLGLLTQVELWTESISTKDREEVVPSDCVEQLRKNLEEKTDGLRNTLHDLLSRRILSPMKQTKDEAEQHAEAESQTWRSWHHATYAAWCRNNGIYETRAKGYTNWNQDMLAKMNSVMNDEWAQLDTEIDSNLDTLRDDIQSTVAHFLDILKKGKVSRVFMDLVRTQRGDLLHQIDDEGVKLQKCIRETNMNATSGDTTSFIYDLMTSTYRSCATDSGAGVTARSRAKIQSRLKERTLFSGIQDKARRQMRQHFENFDRDSREHMKRLCSAVEQNIEIVATAEAGTQRTSTELLDQIKVLVVKNKQAWMRVEADSRRARERAREQ